MTRTLRAALAAFAIAFCCAPALAQSSTDLQGRPVMVPCGGTSTPIAGIVSATLGGFQPTPAYASGTTSASDQTAALPTGTEFIVTNTGSNAMAFNIGANGNPYTLTSTLGTPLWSVI
jgi:hypothetical protein